MTLYWVLKLTLWPTLALKLALRRKVIITLGMLCITAQSSLAAQDNQIFSTRENQQLIDKAITLKSSDLAQSSQIISILKSRTSRLSKVQNQQLNYLIAYQYSMKGQYDNAILYHRKNLNSIDPSIRIKANNNILFIEALLGNYDQSIAYLEPIFQILNNETLNTRDLYETYNTLAYFYLNIDAPAEALTKLNDIELLDLASISNRDLCFTYTQKANALLALEKLSTTDPLIAKGLKHCGLSNESNLYLQLIVAIAEKHILDQQYKQAEVLLLDHIQMVDELSYPLDKLIFYAKLANAQQSLNKLNKAKSSITKALSYKDDSGSPRELLIAYEIAHKIAQQQNDTLETINALRQKLTLVKIHNQNIRLKTVAYNKMQSKISSLEVELQETQQFINQEVKRQQHQQMMTQKFESFIIGGVIYISFLVIFIVILIKVIYDSIRKIQAIEQEIKFDSNTKLLLRPYFLNLCQENIDKLTAEQGSYALLVFNIDDLRRLNETHGDDRCNRLIETILSTSELHFPKGTITGNLNGGEYALFVPYVYTQKVEENLAGYQQEIVEIGKKQINSLYTLTISFGIADNVVENTINIERLVKQAELALGKQKQEKKENRIS